MTDDEAKTKWCPFVRFSEQGSNRFLPADHMGRTDRCIASDCMAWRWDLPWTEDRWGYCGLAGKP